MPRARKNSPKHAPAHQKAVSNGGDIAIPAEMKTGHPDLDHFNLQKLIPVALASDRTCDGSPFLWTDAPDKVKLGRNGIQTFALRQFEAVYNMCKMLEAIGKSSKEALTFRASALNNPAKPIPVENGNKQMQERPADESFVRMSLQLLEAGVVEVMVNMLTLTINTFIMHSILKALATLTRVDEVSVKTLIQHPWLPRFLQQNAVDNRKDAVSVQLPAANLLLGFLKTMHRKNLQEFLSMMKQDGQTAKSMAQRLHFLQNNDRKLQKVHKFDTLDKLVEALYHCCVMTQENSSLLNEFPGLREFLACKCDMETDVYILTNTSVIHHCYNRQCSKVIGQDNSGCACTKCGIATFCVSRNHGKTCIQCPDVKCELALVDKMLNADDEQRTEETRRNVNSATSINLEVPSDQGITLSQSRYLEAASDNRVNVVRAVSPQRPVRPLELPPRVLWRRVEKRVKEAMMYHIGRDRCRRYNMPSVYNYIDHITDRTINIHRNNLCRCGDPIEHYDPLRPNYRYGSMQHSANIAWCYVRDIGIIALCYVRDIGIIAWRYVRDIVCICIVIYLGLVGIRILVLAGWLAGNTVREVTEQ